MSRRPPKEAPDPIDLHVGQRLKARRVGLRISQSEIGKALGVTFQQIQKYENGANRVGASNLFKLSQALNVNVGYFFEDMPDASKIKSLSDQPAAEFNHDPMTQPESIKLVHNYFRIAAPGVRSRVFQLVKSIADAEELNPSED
ncbi:helix-turn-helix transcriptional regulator [Magnetovibrio sp. PR-2]|uniref:helix-turn-helix domain-containing protein n=1 Tax=Magnetovibrio sp. PR-2 TaxID=3120356 RepID=UPI002FCE2135